MLGFLFGTACLIGLIAVVRRGRCGYAYGGGCGGGYGHHRHGFHGDYEGGDRWGFGERVVLRTIFERLDTTPGQEKVIAEALRELRKSGEDVRGEVHKSRGDLAGAMRAGYFDENTMGELFARHDTALLGLRKSLVGALAKVHEVLDERQRARLAELIEQGLFRGNHGGGRWRGER